MGKHAVVQQRGRSRGPKGKPAKAGIVDPGEESAGAVIPLAGGHRPLLEVLPLAFDREGGEDGEYTKETFPELKSVIFFGRQLLALVIGIIFGAVPATGAIPLFAYLAGEFALINYYVTSFLPVRIDDVDQDNPLRPADPEAFTQTELAMEGMFPAAATLLLSWIFVFNLLYPDTNLNEIPV